MENILLEIVKEKGIVDIILDYENQLYLLEHKKKMRRSLEKIDDIMFAWISGFGKYGDDVDLYVLENKIIGGNILKVSRNGIYVEHSYIRGLSTIFSREKYQINWDPKFWFDNQFYNYLKN